MSAPQRMTTREFFAARFADLEEGETIEIRPIHATSGRHHPREFCRTVDEAVAFVGRIEEGYEVYYGVNPRRGRDGTKAGVSRIFAIVADADDKHFSGDPEASYDAIMGFELAPTGVVRTGRGWHPYWELAGPLDNTPQNRDRIELLQRRLYLRLGGLDSVQDISRILRVPGTQNWKIPSEPLPVYVECWNGRQYQPADFEPWLPVLPPTEVTYRETAAVLPDGERPSLDLLRTLLVHIDPCLPYGEYILIWAAVAYYYPDDDGLALVDAWSSAAREAAGQYSSPRTQPEKHAGFRRQSGRVSTLGTLIHYAKAGGYEVPRTPLNIVTRGRRKREIASRLEELPNPTYDELPHFLRKFYDHLGPLTEGLPRDLITVTSLTACSILWPGVRFENLPLSLYLNLIMEQGSGKSIVTAELQQVMRLVRGAETGYFTGGTPQGMYAAMNKSAGKSLYADLDEFGDFLQILRQEYMAGARGVLNKLYDGAPIDYQRSKDGISIHNPHVVIIAATTPRMFIDNITNADLEGGFASRFWYLAPEWVNAGRHAAPAAVARLALANELKEHVASCAHVTAVRFDSPDGIPPAAYAEYERECGVGTGERRGIMDALNNPVSPKGRYLARVKRAAGNLELLDIRPRIHGNTVVVRDHYLRLALTLVKRTQAYSDLILDLVSGSEDEVAMTKILRAIGSREEGLTRGEIMQRTHVKVQMLNRVLPVLDEGGEAEEVLADGKVRWRLPGRGPGPRLKLLEAAD